jgi:hypothetical protein
MSNHHASAKSQTIQTKTAQNQTAPKILRVFLYLFKPFHVQSEVALQSLFSVLAQHNIELQVADPE